MSWFNQTVLQLIDLSDEWNPNGRNLSRRAYLIFHTSHVREFSQIHSVKSGLIPAWQRSLHYVHVGLLFIFPASPFWDYIDVIWLRLALRQSTCCTYVAFTTFTRNFLQVSSEDYGKFWKLVMLMSLSNVSAIFRYALDIGDVCGCLINSLYILGGWKSRISAICKWDYMGTTEPCDQKSPREERSRGIPVPESKYIPRYPLMQFCDLYSLSGIIWIIR
jgi:hypothetical protein